MKYAGVLASLLASVQNHAPVKSGSLMGQEVVVPKASSSVFLCVDSYGHTHLLMTPSSGSPEKFDRFKLRFMSISNRSWVVLGREPREYLDICCKTGERPTLERPFISFCEDILVDLEEAELPEQAVYRTCRRWKQFWAEEEEENFSMEWLRGMLGELVFLLSLIERYGCVAIQTWAGPDARDHDFQSGTDVAFEVKTGATLPFVITCNLRQLDNGIFSELYVVCILVRRMDGGVTLPELVRRIESHIGENEDASEEFYSRLSRAGYRLHLESAYSGQEFSLSAPEFFKVDEYFPRVTFASFGAPLDARIRELRYSVELSGLEPLAWDEPSVNSSLEKLCS